MIIYLDNSRCIYGTADDGTDYFHEGRNFVFMRSIGGEPSEADLLLANSPDVLGLMLDTMQLYLPVP